MLFCRLTCLGLETLPIITEYFIDQEKYFYFVILYLTVVILIGIVTGIGIGTMFITFFQHIYAMFKIVRYVNKVKIRDNNKKKKRHLKFKYNEN
jgi:predicted Co/Zn/Cd cation transporter (cation efflux family)